MSDINSLSFQPPSFGSRSDKSPIWVLINGSEVKGIIEFTLRDISKCLSDNKIQCAIISPIHEPRMKDEDLKKALRDINPAGIIWSGAVPWIYWDVFKEFNCKKINVWFDEPINPIETMDVGRQVYEGGKAGVLFFMWDRYWSEQIHNKYSVICQDIELAAHDGEYYPGHCDYTGEATFIGSLHSPRQLQHMVDYLPKIFGEYVNMYQSWLNSQVFHVEHFSVFLNEFESQETREYYFHLKKMEPAAYRTMKWVMWCMGKNRVRVDMLRNALRVTPVIVCSEMRQLNHANEYELRAMVGQWGKRLHIIDTSMVKVDQLGFYYHHGSIHISATDPQSMWGGIPFRLYHCAASGRPILTDVRKDWKNSFEYEKEIITYDSWESFEGNLSIALNNKDHLIEVGANARKRFEAEHTWKHRVKKLIGGSVFEKEDAFESGLSEAVSRLKLESVK